MSNIFNCDSASAAETHLLPAVGGKSDPAGKLPALKSVGSLIGTR